MMIILLITHLTNRGQTYVCCCCILRVPVSMVSELWFKLRCVLVPMVVVRVLVDNLLWWGISEALSTVAVMIFVICFGSSVNMILWLGSCIHGGGTRSELNPCIHQLVPHALIQCSCISLYVILHDFVDFKWFGDTCICCVIVSEPCGGCCIWVTCDVWGVSLWCILFCWLITYNCCEYNIFLYLL